MKSTINDLDKDNVRAHGHSMVALRKIYVR